MTHQTSNNDPAGVARDPGLVSVVIPTHNEAANLERMVVEVTRILDHCGVATEVIVVDDGSGDGTFDVALRACERDSRVRAIRLSRNFGKEAALLAGLSAARGEAVITLDADFQHPPAFIPELLEHWRQGAKVVHGVKRSRESDSWVVRTRAVIFNALMARMTDIDVRNSSDFKLLDRVAVDAIVLGLPEHSRFYRGLASWIGYRNATVPFDVAAREQGKASMSLTRVLGLAIGALVAFTTAPLRIVTLLGVLTLCFGFVVGAETLLSWWRGAAVSGFATLILTILIVGSFIMISLGIIGEYIAKIYEEIKRRPAYLIESTKGFEKDRGDGHGRPADDRRQGPAP